MPTFCLVPDLVTGTRVWPWFFSGLNNETPPSSSAGRTPPPGWRGALGDLPGFRREGRGGGRPGGRGPCPHPLAPGASVVPVRPPSRRRPRQPPAGLAGALRGVCSSGSIISLPPGDTTLQGLRLSLLLWRRPEHSGPRPTRGTEIRLLLCSRCPGVSR